MTVNEIPEGRETRQRHWENLRAEDYAASLGGVALEAVLLFEGKLLLAAVALAPVLHTFNNVIERLHKEPRQQR